MLAVSHNSSKASRLPCNFSLLVWSSQYYTQWVGILISMGTMASIPYGKENGVFPIPTLGEILQAYNILGNSFAHLAFSPFNLFFSLVRIVQLVTSIFLLVWGWATNVNLWFIPKFFAKFLNSLQSNWVPLFDMRTWETPNLHIMLPHTKSIILPSYDAFDCLEFWPFWKVFYSHYHIFSLIGGLGEGPRISIPH